MGRGTANESEEASDKPFEWSESDAPGDSRCSSAKGNKGHCAGRPIQEKITAWYAFDSLLGSWSSF
ncbi:hypothetical protein PAXRUDRAFT_20860 [Paxillus rubicundulus Ve08.2h10]|uniref:Unplaced genomic scaffold scaffold_4937, whole genome shotgun sequence n=1 Tax=Paxillus rubicundulus Ve08.2h10 TaxID=930991 RepID=A0A0D0D0W3_9AGAM|nr:hypothetical protein PAXRUDRAFT_20860 [Paxillus rubicundulus Ve08.2h10]